MSRPSSRNDTPSSYGHSHSRSTSRRSSLANGLATHSNHQPDPYAFCNSFWGDFGFDALQSKTRQSTKMLEDLRLWYKERAAIEEEYARRLARLAKSSLLDGDHEAEVGGLRRALDVVRDTTRQSAHSHLELAGTIRTALEKKVVEFLARRDLLKKNPQASIERLHRKKIELMEITEKFRRRYEADAITVNGLSAQTHLVQGRDFDKVSAKLDKAQQNVQVNEREYRLHVKNLKDTAAEWNVQWKGFCDLVQDMEEERIDYIRTSFWDYANGVSTICVVDDEQCENIRKALEHCETMHDLVEYVRQARTGNEMFTAPDYVNYARGEQAPYNRPQASIANFVRSSTRSTRTVPTTTNIQDLAQAIRSGPSSPTDPIPSAPAPRPSSKSAVKRGGAIADAVAANSYRDNASAGLVPRPSVSRSAVGASISRAASPAEAMAQVVGSSTSGSVSNRTNGHPQPNNSTSAPPVVPPPAVPPTHYPPQFTHPNRVEPPTSKPEKPTSPPLSSSKPPNRYAPNAASELPKRTHNAPPSSSHNNGPPGTGPNLPLPSHRPASRSSTSGPVQPPSVPAESGAVDPLVVALEKLRTTPSNGSFRRSPVPPPSPSQPRDTNDLNKRRMTTDQPSLKRASSPAPSSRRGTQDQPMNIPYKPPSSPAQSHRQTGLEQPGSQYHQRASSPAQNPRRSTGTHDQFGLPGPYRPPTSPQPSSNALHRPPNSAQPLATAQQKLASSSGHMPGMMRPTNDMHSNGGRSPSPQPMTNAQYKRASSPAQYKRASSPAPMAAMMQAPTGMHSNGGRSPSPQPTDRYHNRPPRTPSPSGHHSRPSRAPSPSGRAPSPSGRPTTPLALLAGYRPPGTERPKSYAGPPLGVALDARGGVVDPSRAPSPSGAARLQHHHSHNQLASAMVTSPISYTGGGNGPNGQMPFSQPPPAGPGLAHPQSSYMPSHRYTYNPGAQPAGTYQQQPPPQSTTPVPHQAYQPPGQYSIPPSQSFPPQQQQQQQYYNQAPASVGPPAQTQSSSQVRAGAVQRAASMYGASVAAGQQQQGQAQPAQGHGQQYYQQQPGGSGQQPQQQLGGQGSQGATSKAHSPTGQYSSEGLPILFYVRALYDYTATMPEEFSFQANEVIGITRTDPDGWWHGELVIDGNGVDGKGISGSGSRNRGGGNVLPSNFVEVMK